MVSIKDELVEVTETESEGSRRSNDSEENKEV